MSFYDDMADTVTELLTEFGQTVTLSRSTTTFDPVIGMNTESSTASLETIGVIVPIRQSLIDGTRVQVGDKLYTLGPDVEPLMADKIDGWSIIAIEPINPAGTVLAYKVQVRR